MADEITRQRRAREKLRDRGWVDVEEPLDEVILERERTRGDGRAADRHAHECAENLVEEGLRVADTLGEGGDGEDVEGGEEGMNKKLDDLKEVK